MKTLVDKIDRKITRILSGFYIKGFHKLYYYNHKIKATWLGVPIQKIPFDMWTYQEIIFETRPDIIIETGTADGASALFLRHFSTF